MWTKIALFAEQPILLRHFGMQNGEQLAVQVLKTVTDCFAAHHCCGGAYPIFLLAHWMKYFMFGASV